MTLEKVVLCIQDMVQKRSAFFLLGWLSWSVAAASLPEEERERNDSHEEDKACEYEVVAVYPSHAQNSWYFVCLPNVEWVLFDLNEALDERHKKKIGHQPVDLKEPFVVVAHIH